MSAFHGDRRCDLNALKSVGVNWMETKAKKRPPFMSLAAGISASGPRKIVPKSRTTLWRESKRARSRASVRTVDMTNELGSETSSVEYLHRDVAKSRREGARNQTRPYMETEPFSPPVRATVHSHQTIGNIMFGSNFFGMRPVLIPGVRDRAEEFSDLGWPLVTGTDTLMPCTDVLFAYWHPKLNAAPDDGVRKILNGLKKTMTWHD